MAGTAVTFLSVTLAHVILRLRVARENNWIPKRDGYIHIYIQTISEMRRSCLALRRSAIIKKTACSAFEHMPVQKGII